MWLWAVGEMLHIYELVLLHLVDQCWRLFVGLRIYVSYFIFFTAIHSSQTKNL